MLVGEAGYVLAEVGRRAHRDVAHDPDHQQPQEAVQDPREAVLAEGLAFWVLVVARKKGGRITRVRFGKGRTAPDGQTDNRSKLVLLAAEGARGRDATHATRNARNASHVVQHSHQ